MKRLRGVLGALVALAVGCGEEDPSVWADEYAAEAIPEEIELEETFGGDYRLRGAIYNLDLVTDDTIEAIAHDSSVPIHVDTGNMVYSKTLDQAMVDQLNAVAAAGGTNELVVTLRKGLSFSGAGTGNFSGIVEATVGGSPVATPVPDSGSTSGSSNRTIRFPIASGLLFLFTAGSTLEVRASGFGTAWSNGTSLFDQSTVTWRVTSGPPYLRSVP